MYNMACLLVLAGEPLHYSVLAEFDSEHITKWWPVGPLSAIALSGRFGGSSNGCASPRLLTVGYSPCRGQGEGRSHRLNAAPDFIAIGT